MLQTVDGRENVYVVDLDTVPELPITWETEEEKPYAIALAESIDNGMITEPGKYGIVILKNDDHGMHWSTFRIIEE